MQIQQQGSRPTSPLIRRRYGLRHFFASSSLTNRILITDVAEWTGHRSLDITFRAAVEQYADGSLLRHPSGPGPECARAVRRLWAARK